MSKPKIEDEDIGATCFYIPQVNYELTINPREQHFKKKTRSSKCVETCSAIMELFRDVATFEMYPELSEPRFGNIERGSEARWHYHGVVRFNDELAVGIFLLEKVYMLKRMCDFSINSYRKEHWNKYIKKQEKIMKPLTKYNNLPYVLTSNRPQFVSTL